jgi:hypothetical protein
MNKQNIRVIETEGLYEIRRVFKNNEGVLVEHVPLLLLTDSFEELETLAKQVRMSVALPIIKGGKDFPNIK